MSSSYCFEVRAFGCNIQLAADCLETQTLLERYTFPSFPKTAPTLEKPDISLRIAKVTDHFQLFSNDIAVASATQPIALIPDLTRVLDDFIIERLTTLRAVHAGAVLWGERALLLPGSTHAGKSSLVAEFLRQGATYFSDEYALIDSEGRVHPYPRPLLLRNGSPNQFPALPEQFNALTGHKPAPIGWILSLEYQSEAVWNLSPITQSEALLTLLRNTPHILAESPEMVAFFQRAVTGTACYAGRRSEAAEAAVRILELIDKPATN